MPIVPVELFRCGNQAGPNLTRVRIGTDVATITAANGAILVLPNTGGVSAFASITTLRGQWWKISRGSWYDPRLSLCPGVRGHWTWEPSKQMSLGEYIDGLRETGLLFTIA